METRPFQSVSFVGKKHPHLYPLAIVYLLINGGRLKDAVDNI
jgi:hypothetical protein